MASYREFRSGYIMNAVIRYLIYPLSSGCRANNTDKVHVCAAAKKKSA